MSDEEYAPVLGPWMNTTEAAKYLSLSERVTRELMNMGDMKGRKLGHAWRTCPQWCDDFILGLSEGR